MPSPGNLRRRRPRQAQPHTVADVDRELERLSDLARSKRPHVRADALRRADCWLDERLRAMAAADAQPVKSLHEIEWPGAA
jgi:hypothetical protein